MTKVQIHIKEQLPDAESKKDFKKLVYAYQKGTKPLYKVHLYKYKNRYYFFGIVVILALIYLLWEFMSD